ncbi:MAG: hypothetical protein NXH82_07995 [Rhodobacteraceae bacterium]|nr:hypothetical protein [Paracoccaceae bacterium]
MVNNSKILTVSYGTFSCTLEGFDDSFGTMKAIAEYFRDLASNDRYFGAEPPQPDAEMLARIAEREIARRVDARTDEGRIVLRAEQAAPPAAQPARPAAEVAAVAAPAIAAAAAAPVQAAASDAADDGSDHEDEGEDDTTLSDLLAEDLDEAPAKPTPVAARAQRPAAPAENAFVADDDDDEEDDYDTDDGGDDIFAEAEAFDDDPDDDADAEDIGQMPDAAEADSIAAKLQRIRAVVFRGSAAKGDEHLEDEHADTLATNVVAQDAGPEALFDEDDEDDEGDVAEMLDRLGTIDRHEEDDDPLAALFDEDDDEDAPEESPVNAAVSRTLRDAAPRNFARDSRIQEAETDQDGIADDASSHDEWTDQDDDGWAARADEEDTWRDQDGTDEDEAEDAPQVAQAAPPPRSAPVEPPAPALQRRPVQTPPPQPATGRARVIRVKRSELDSAIANGTLGDIQDQAETAARASFDDMDMRPAAKTRAAMAPLKLTPEDSVASARPLRMKPQPETDEGALPPEQEAELQEELAQVEAELKAEEARRAARSDAQREAGIALRRKAEAEAREKAEAEARAKSEADARRKAAEDRARAEVEARRKAAEDRARAKAEEEARIDGAEEEKRRKARAEQEAAAKARADAEAAARAEADQEEAQAAARRAAENTLRPRRRAVPESADADLSRLLDKADTQMGAPETSSRRAEISHLRAAVAARKAEGATAEADKAELDQAYRADLANAVRPRRPAAGGARDARPAAPDQRPTPLKLVAEQRVDVRAATKSGPVRPRRIAAEDPAPIDVDSVSGFADFAQKMGAEDLPDLLEAAAAYLSFVEGRDQFSRPQLMTKVRMVEQEDFSREDGLRSFGQLLRDGKISKIKGGRFTVSDSIGFRPDDRAVG